MSASDILIIKIKKKKKKKKLKDGRDTTPCFQKPPLIINSLFGF